MKSPQSADLRQICPECQANGSPIEVHSIEKNWQNKTYYTWVNPDGSTHQVKGPDGKYVHAPSKEAGIAAKSGGTATMRPVAENQARQNPEKQKEYIDTILSDEDRQLGIDIVKKVIGYDLLWGLECAEAPIDQSPAHLGQIKNLASAVLRDIKENQRKQVESDK